MFEGLSTMIVAYAGRALLAIVILLVGVKIINRFAAAVDSRLDTMRVEAALRSFVRSFGQIILKIMLVISVASMLGVEMTSFVAVLGALAFAVGLALQGSLANFSGGVLILLLRPFTVGDFIDANGYMGTVREIQIFYTVLATPDNRKVIIPNAALSNTSMVNFSAHDTRRVDLKFGVGYESDIDQVKEILHGLIDDHPLVKKDPAPMIMLAEHGDSALVFFCRFWCAAGDYWPLYWEMMEKSKKAFDAAGVNIPFPQMDVHLAKEA